MDWYEIMNFYAFDIEKADKTAKKLIKWNPVEEALRHGVGRLESESNGAQGGRLRGESGCEGA